MDKLYNKTLGKNSMKINILAFKIILFITFASSQYYQVGDQIENFGAPFCMNDNGADTWNYDQHGTNKIIFLSLFATW